MTILARFKSDEYNPHRLIAQTDALEGDLLTLADDGLRGWWQLHTEDRRWYQVPRDFARHIGFVLFEDLPKVARALFWRALGRERMAMHLFRLLDVMRYAAPDWYHTAAWSKLLGAASAFYEAERTGAGLPPAVPGGAPAIELVKPAPAVEPVTIRLELTVTLDSGDGRQSKTLTLTA